jgi:hypothetical protein
MFHPNLAVKGDPAHRDARPKLDEDVCECRFPEAQDSFPRPMNAFPSAITGNRLAAWLKSVDFGPGIRPLNEIPRNFPVKFPP